MAFIASVSPYVTCPTSVFFILIHLFYLAHSLLYWGTILFRCVGATCAMLAWTFCCAGFSLIPRLLSTSTFLIGTVALTPTVITCTVGLTFQPSLGYTNCFKVPTSRITDVLSIHRSDVVYSSWDVLRCGTIELFQSSCESQDVLSIH